MMDKYRKFLWKIAREITADELQTMKFWCADFITYTELPQTRTTLMEAFDFYFRLEAQNRLDIDNLDFLKSMLDELNRQELALDLVAFQFQRETYLSSLSAGERESERNQTIYRSQQEENQEEDQRRRSEPEARGQQQAETVAVNPQTSRGSIVMQCVPYLVGGAWIIGSGYILNRYKEDPKTLVNLVNEVVVPTGTLVRTIFAGSINFLLQATDLNSLKELWKRYQTGRLKEDLEKVIVTEELKNLANGEPIDLVVTINENEYRNACLDLMVAQTKADTLFKGIMSPEPARQVSRSLPDLTSLDTIQDLSRDLLLVRLSDDLKKRQYARKVKKSPSIVWSTKNVSSLLQQINSIRFEINSLEISIGKSPSQKHREYFMFEYDRGKYEQYIIINRSFSTFATRLEEVNTFLKDERFLLQPQEAVKRLVSLACDLRFHSQDPSWRSVLEDLRKMRWCYHFEHDADRNFQTSVKNLTTKLKKMAELLVNLFKLDSKLLEVKPELEDKASDDDDDDDDDDDGDHDFDSSMRIKAKTLSSRTSLTSSSKEFSKAPVEESGDPLWTKLTEAK